jgi:hypothetical protein
VRIAARKACKRSRNWSTQSAAGAGKITVSKSRSAIPQQSLSLSAKVPAERHWRHRLLLVLVLGQATNGDGVQAFRIGEGSRTRDDRFAVQAITLGRSGNRLKPLPSARRTPLYGSCLRELRS